MDELSHRMLITESDTELMVHKIQRLSGESQNVVKLAAAIGNKFSALTLAGVMSSFVHHVAHEQFSVVYLSFLLSQ